jgi:hypothetical protein
MQSGGCNSQKFFLKIKFPFKQSNLPWLASLSVILGILYWRTLQHVMGTWGDAVKMQFLGKVLGTPHLSGTPLYVMINHIFVTLVPKGNLAFRANLLSACLSIITIWFIYEILTLLELRKIVAFVTTLVFGLGYTFWSQSLMAEVYILMMLFMVSVTYFLLKWNRTRQDRYFLLASALYALSFGNHLLIIGFLPAFIYMTLATDWRIVFRPKMIALVSLFIVIGISQYGYIVWRTNDPSTPYLEATTGSLLMFVSNPLSSGASRFHWDEIINTRLPMFVRFFWREYYLLIPLGVLGFFQIKRRTIRFFVSIIFLFTLTVAFVRYAREYEVYFLPVYLSFTICISYGLEWVTDKWLTKDGLLAFLLVIPLLFMWVNYAKVDHSDRTLYARIVEKVLNEVESNALIVAPNYDYAEFYWYYLIGEGFSAQNIYCMQVNYKDLDAIRAYLNEERSITKPDLRTEVPFGLRVYVMEETAKELKKSGLIVRSTGSRYVYQVLLPDNGR